VAIHQENELKQSLRRALCDQVVAIEQRRLVVEQKWLLSRRKWMGLHWDARYMSPESGPGEYNIPEARRTEERTINRVVMLLTPSAKWYNVQPAGETSQERLSNIDNYMGYVLRKKIKTRSNISQLSRCAVLYGMAVMKTSVAMRNGQVWPAQRAVDPFAFYIFPETSPTIEEAEVVFENLLFSYERYKTFAAMGMVDDLERRDITSPKWPYHLVERLAYQGITDPTANVDIEIEKVGKQLEQTTAAFVSMTELWLTREDKLYQVYIAWNLTEGPRIVGFFQSQYQQPLYRASVYRPLPGETYTSGLADDIGELETLCNDQLNMFVEAVDREQGFLAFGGGQSIRRDQLKMKGGAKWDMGADFPKDVLQFFSPPVTSTNMLRAWQIYMAKMQSMGGAGTIAEGQPGRNMPRAGFAMQSLMDLGMADVKDVAQMLEQEILTGSLADIYTVSSFIPDSQLMSVPGGIALYGNQQSNLLKKQDILGDVEFEWVGAIQFQDERQNAQNMMMFMNLIPQIAPILAQEGYRFNVSELLQMVWRYSLGQRSLNKIIVPLPPQPPQPLLPGPGEGGANTPQGAQGGVPPPQGAGVPGLSIRMPQPSLNGT